MIFEPFHLQQSQEKGVFYKESHCHSACICYNGYDHKPDERQNNGRAVDIMAAKYVRLADELRQLCFIHICGQKILTADDHHKMK